MKGERERGERISSKRFEVSVVWWWCVVREKRVDGTAEKKESLLLVKGREDRGFR